MNKKIKKYFINKVKKNQTETNLNNQNKVKFFHLLSPIRIIFIKNNLNNVIQIQCLIVLNTLLMKIKKFTRILKTTNSFLKKVINLSFLAEQENP